MFSFCHKPHILILLPYLDDIRLSDNSISLLSSFISTLSKQSSMKDMGESSVLSQICLCLRISTSLTFLNFFFIPANLFSVLLLLGSPITLSNDELHANPIEYRSIVGMLQYLTMTHPKVAYVVHVVSQLMHAPHGAHLSTVKRIFKYLQGTLANGIHIKPATSLSLIVAYSDANSAGCKDICQIATGYAMNLILLLAL